MNTQKYLVTGADGFIGSHLVEYLLDAGHRVRAFVMYNSFNSWGWLDTLPRDMREQIEVFPGDIRDPNGVRTAMEGCEIVMHLAALIGIPYSYHSPDSYADTNVKGTLNVLQAARQIGVERVVHTSTSEVYGTAQFVPITEEHPLNAQSPYAATKIGADQIALSFHRSFDTPVAVARPFNTYGPRQSARAVIPTIITQIVAGARSVELGALHPTRDFTFVTDTVRGLVAISKCENAIGQVINIGSGFEISIGALAHMIVETMAVNVEIKTSSKRARPASSEVDRLLADNTKAAEILGWSPEYGGTDGLRHGLQIAADWFSQAENLASYKTEIFNI